MSNEPTFPYRHRLALALDVDDVVEAVRLATDLREFFGIAKVGLELFSSAGPEAISALRNAGFEVFADLKLHDIPTTVHKAARVMGAVGARYLTLHAQNGVPMLRAGVEGLLEGAAQAGQTATPVALAVTVLTSDADAPPHIVPTRAKAAVEAGCGGLVCAAGDLAAAAQYAEGLIKVVPGIRKAGGEVHDQARATNPKAAFDLGADILVIGRAVTAAEVPLDAARELFAELL